MTKAAWAFVGIAVLAGFVSGPSALMTATASEPPLGWPSVFLVFAGSTAALFMVIGFQYFMGKSATVVLAWKQFALVTIYMAATGIAALVVATAEGQFAPSSVLFLALAAGCTLSLVAVRKMFNSAFRNDA